MEAFVKYFFPSPAHWVVRGWQIVDYVERGMMADGVSKG
jgi:hypothetical protein